MQEAKRIALLIDCDNVSHTAIEGVLEELAKHGTVTKHQAMMAGHTWGQVASCISNNNSSFSSINYGFTKISELIKATELFKVDMRNGTAMYIKDLRN